MNQIEQVSVEQLIPYARNSRTHSDAQVAQIAASIKEFGWTNPILIDGDGGIIAGHGRLMAARKLKQETVPVIKLTHLSEAQKKALIIADNKLALNAGWDEEMLRVELADLMGEDYDLSVLGFDEDELANLLQEEVEATEGNTDPDEAPEPPENPVTVLGDVWVLGGHRLMCGDSTSIDAVEKLMGGVKADMVFTDPPYGMSYDGGRGKKQFGMIKNDDAEGLDLIQLVQDAISLARQFSKSGSATYVCFPWRTYTEFESSLKQCGLDLSACIVWDKKSIGLGHQHYRPQHEFIFYSKGDSFHGDRSESDVWYMSRGNTGAYVHPTQKPVELIERAISNSSKSGDICIDLFGGSGSTMIACEKSGRLSRLMELDPKYCDVIIKRWQDFTGKQATLESTGQAFADVASGRVVEE